MNVSFKNLIIEYRSKVEICDYNYEIASDFLLSNALSSNQKITDFFVTDEEDNDVLLSSIFNKNYMLVLYFSEITCKTCVDSVFNLLNDYSQEVGTERIFILTSYKNKRDFNSFKRINQVNFNIYNLHGEKLNLLVEKYNIPFLFVMNDKLYSQNVFLIEKSKVSLNEAYLKGLINNYFKP